MAALLRILGMFVLAASLAGAGAPAADLPKKAAFFGILLINTSAEETRPEEEGRRQAMEAQLVETMTASGRYAFVDTAPVAAKANLYSNLAHCNGCDAQLASELGADIAVSGEIQKTSNLILSISVYLRDAQSGELIGGGSADIRGNTDESWSRGMRYILKNRILK